MGELKDQNKTIKHVSLEFKFLIVSTTFLWKFIERIKLVQLQIPYFKN